jgi:hypothetical protein
MSHHTERHPAQGPDGRGRLPVGGRAGAEPTRFRADACRDLEHAGEARKRMPEGDTQ